MGAGRPRKYNRIKRFLLSLDADMMVRFESLLGSKDTRSGVVNELITKYVKECEGV